MSRILDDSQDLLVGIAESSTEAFELFYEKYHRFIYSIALKILEDPLEAEDICHDIFIEISKKAHTYDQKKGSIKSWLAIRARSRCIDLLRRKREVFTEEIQVRRENDSIKQYVPLEEKLAIKMDRQIIFNALQQLPRSQREAIIGNYYHNYSHKELASLYDVPLGTVKSWIRYGINHLRKHLEQRKDLSLKGDEDSGM